MRILLLSGSYPPVLGGVQTVTHTLARHLIRRNHKVQVIANRYPRSLPAREMLDGVPVSRLLFLTPRIDQIRRRRPDLFLASVGVFPATLFRLNYKLANFFPDVINVHFPDTQTPFVLWLKKRFHFRLVVSLHGHEIMRWFGEGGTDLARLDDLKRLLRSADVVTACSQFLLERVVELEKAISNKGRVIHNGVNLCRFEDKHPYRHSRPYILAFGRLVHKKGFDLLLDAFAQITVHNSDIDLIITGDGEETSRLQAQAVELGIHKRVKFVRWAAPETVVQLLSGCLFVVVPSRSEPFGITALEAMAAGRPVLATNVGGLPEFVSSENNCLVEPTSEGLLDGLRQWLDHPTGLKKMGEKNREKVAKYSWDQMVDQYMKIFTQEEENA
ncbi:MAG: glycosyltransferase family 4 protein [Anaerolineales bacterium]|nr:glycosyltransferase family 4 protein [Chloroflexota bacterium]MBL6980704.1 glycosyltransferase family 4 protein [Anaerolineales bacterium]